MYVCNLKTPWGPWHLTATDRGITSVVNAPGPAEERWNPHLKRAVQELEAYAVGSRRVFSVPLDPAGTAFQLQVWEALKTIPFGRTVSYSQIAAQIGKPTAVRAVGQAIGRNPCLILIPCHRVVGKDGSLTGFSAGIELKTQLLALERQEEP